MTDRMRMIPVLTAVAILLPAIAAAECPDEQTSAAGAEAFFNKTPAKAYPDGVSLEDAYCGQEKYLALLGKKLGDRAGRKAG